MAITVEQNKTFCLRSELFKLKDQLNKSTALRLVLATALLVAGIATIIFMHATFLPLGIAAVVIASFAIHQIINHCRDINRNISISQKNLI